MNFTQKMVSIDTHSITIDSLTLPFYDYFQVIEENGISYLLGFNRQQVSLDFIPLDGDSIPIRHIFFEEDGPGSIEADLDMFWYFNSDSIVMIQDRSKRMKVFNVRGELLSAPAVQLRDNKGTQLYPVAYAHQGQRPIFETSNWILPVYPDIDVASANYYKKDKFVVWDPVTNEAKTTFGAYPEVYRGDAYYDILREPTLTHSHRSTYLVTFPADPSIYEYILDSSNVVQHHYPKLKQYENVGVKRYADFQQFVNHYISSAWFQQVLFDPYRQVYYRFLKEKQDLINPQGTKNTALDAQWKILIMDKALNVVGATDLDTQTYNPMFTFVRKNGLYIFSNERKNDDEMVFGIFNWEEE
ncbi:hypothetical protein A3SI_10954 [Nitritalea halalkaliphila LW7]|uniref:6-bladed beta-propeller n=1 Tax=Nitritalea halalkaliphila LW7 TaxID=1189621 RepID=I5C2U6_9BACT|nr:DUF4221 family protein [Nitritalea halalkaliphila]EIM76148.1 hypothetical protein A3SI_10954 [Nitritalea halalkaliphila LW7]